MQPRDITLRKRRRLPPSDNKLVEGLPAADVCNDCQTVEAPQCAETLCPLF